MRKPRMFLAPLFYYRHSHLSILPVWNDPKYHFGNIQNIKITLQAGNIFPRSTVTDSDLTLQRSLRRVTATGSYIPKAQLQTLQGVHHLCFDRKVVLRLQNELWDISTFNFPFLCPFSCFIISPSFPHCYLLPSPHKTHYWSTANWCKESIEFYFVM